MFHSFLQNCTMWVLRLLITKMFHQVVPTVETINISVYFYIQIHSGIKHGRLFPIKIILHVLHRFDYLFPVSASPRKYF